MKLHRSRTFAEHKLVARVRNALLALLLLPLVGIVVGAVVWWDLERGLLVFNLLGMALFAWFTYPFWRGERQRKRRLQLFFSAGSVLLSALVNVCFDHAVAAYALYFAVACEAFSLIPWIIEVIQEIRRGDWQDWQPAPPPFHTVPREPYQMRMGREEPAPWDSPAARVDEFPRQGPELPAPAPPWKLLLPLVLAAFAAAGVWLWQDEILQDFLEERSFPNEEQIAQALEERYGEPFQVGELYCETEGLRTWWVSPEDDPALRFTVATGPAVSEEEEPAPFTPMVGEDNYQAHAWNARVVPVLASHGLAELPLTITEQDLEWGENSGLQLPEPFASDFPDVYTGSTLVGWYILPMAYWAGEEEDWTQTVRELSILLRELQPIAPFCRLGSWQEELDDSLGSISWHDWILPVAVHEGFVGIPIGIPFSQRELAALLEDARPYRYYYVEDGMICRPDTFGAAAPVPVPERPQ